MALIFKKEKNNFGNNSYGEDSKDLLSLYQVLGIL